MEPKMKKRFGTKDRIDAIQRMPCVVCGAKPSQNHHVVSRGAGGTAKDIVPLCVEHHTDFHVMGRRTFQRKYDINLYAEAEKINEHLGDL